MMLTRVFIVAPTPITRTGLRSMLATVKGADVRVVGEATSPAGPNLEPGLSEADVVLVADEEMLEETALAVAEDGTQALVLLSEDDHAASRLRSLPLRGWGLVTPDAPPEELGAAVTAVAPGPIVLPKPLTERLVQETPTREKPSQP